MWESAIKKLPKFVNNYAGETDGKDMIFFPKSSSLACDDACKEEGHNHRRGSNVVEYSEVLPG
jgi:hypothetical protein